MQGQRLQPFLTVGCYEAQRRQLSGRGLCGVRLMPHSIGVDFDEAFEVTQSVSFAQNV